MRRALLLIAASSLALAACGKGDSGSGANAAADTVSAEDFETNDVTAIDAATGADANMAADIDVNEYATDEDEGGNRSASDKAQRAKPRDASDKPAANDGEPAGEAAPAPVADDQPAANSD